MIKYQLYVKLQQITYDYKYSRLYHLVEYQTSYDPIIRGGKGDKYDPIYMFNPATVLCLSQNQELDFQRHMSGISMRPVV